MVESDIRPFQENWVALVDADSGKPILDSHTGEPVRFVGTNPIDVPACSKCHSNSAANGKNIIYTSRKKPSGKAWDLLTGLPI